ncbi:MAG: hypothetical protein ABIU87_00820 [Ornithinibacter sp.]
MVLVLPGGAGRADDLVSSVVPSMGAARANQARVAAVVLNQVPAPEVGAVRSAADSRLTGVTVRVLPETSLLRAPPSEISSWPAAGSSCTGVRTCWTGSAPGSWSPP